MIAFRQKVFLGHRIRSGLSQLLTPDFYRVTLA